MKNRVKPFSQQREKENNKRSRNENLDESLDLLFSNFRSDVASGDIRVKDIADLSKLMNVQTTLDERKLRDADQDTNQVNILDEILEEVDSKDMSIDTLYRLAFEKYNNMNDELNKEN